MSMCPVCDYEFEDSQIGCPRHSNEVEVKPAPKAPSKELLEAQGLIGTTISGVYRLDEIIGKGAMGVVYKALQLKDNKEVALKVLHTHLASDPESIKRFHHEAKAASSLMHANIVRIFDVGVGDGGQPFIVMELLDGITLSRLIKERGRLSTKEALPVIRQICEALAEAHSHGVLHRDIKPANIMLCNRFGVENFVLVLDFSIAKIIQKVSDVDSTIPGLIFGSPTYMSPERFMGKGGDFRSDIYSTGIIMFQLLAGRPPFKSADLYTLMNEHVGSAPPRVKDIFPESDVPDLLEEAIARALAKKPEDRHDNMKQLLAHINEVYHTIQVPRDDSSEEHELVTARMNNTATIITSDANLQVFSSHKGGDKSANYGFEIDPTLTPNAATAGSLQQYPRKSVAPSEEVHRQKLTDFGTSGRWDKSLIGSKSASASDHTIPAHRQRIRPKEGKERFPVELLALALVFVCFLWIMWPRILGIKKTPSTPPAATNGMMP